MSELTNFNSAELQALQKFAAQQVENAQLDLLRAKLSDRIVEHKNELLYQVVDQLHTAQQIQFQASQQQAKLNAKVQHTIDLENHIRSFLQGV